MILLDTLYNINRHLGRGNSIWDILLLKCVIGTIVNGITNYVLPVFLGKSKSNIEENGNRVPVIVSITSFPARIGKVWMTIESILCQTHKPEAIILWLSKEQFPNELNGLPKRLVEQQERGVTIRFVAGDIRSYKKFYYAFLEYKNKFIMTLDDDLLIPSYFLNNIYEYGLQYPNNVIASFGFRFNWDDKIAYIHPTGTKIHSGDTGNNLFFGSGGGTLFNTIVASKMDSIEKIYELCPTADDIYLNALIRICGFGVTFHVNNPLLSVRSKGSIALVNHNGDIGDPNSVNAKQLKRLVAYYENMNIPNPFKNQNI
ncbi:hypothetical protein [Bacteroides acidifaciens]|uniref:hypothetical protein n=1 Tax=Bacteroides acidifaciens TaxID=85831 RepID=UPI003014F186